MADAEPALAAAGAGHAEQQPKKEGKNSESSMPRALRGLQATHMSRYRSKEEEENLVESTSKAPDRKCDSAPKSKAEPQK